jgi:hypothetical protein
LELDSTTSGVGADDARNAPPRASVPRPSRGRLKLFAKKLRERKLLFDACLDRVAEALREELPSLEPPWRWPP